MKFCTVCDNMLYIDVTKENNMKFYCKNCGNNEIVEDDKGSILISEKQYRNDAANLTSFLNTNIKYDMTLPRLSNIVCPQSDCVSKVQNENEVIYIKYDHENMKYLYYCCKCNHFWQNSES